MKIQTRVSLKPFITFSIDEMIEQLIEVNTPNELEQALEKAHPPIHILGGGSNILPTGTLQGTVLLNRIKGIEIVKEEDEHVWVCFSSGEIWHECVMWAVERNLGGIENLALIPGTIGAAPLQNIGAYGVELKDVFFELEAFHLHTKEKRTFDINECQFGYRESVFKHEEKNKYYILSVTLRLQKKPTLHLEYGMIQDELMKMEVTDVHIKHVAEAVMRIRRSKLPDPAVIGNAGSFFKNPVIPIHQFNSLKEQFPNIPHYPASEGIKIPAAWLIEQCGWKGKRMGPCGVHDKQALVLVNFGEAKGSSIFDLSVQIIQSVEEKFGVRLHREVNIW